MKKKDEKVVSFSPKPCRIVDKMQEDILKERKNKRHEYLDQLLNRKNTLSSITNEDRKN